MGLSFFASPRIGEPHYVARRVTAVIASFVMLFQAMLFAWHHHTHFLRQPDLPAVGSIVVVSIDPALPSDDDDCQICFALGHHPAASVDFLAAPSADPEPLPLFSAASFPHALPCYFLFHSRAPPRA